MEIRRVGPISTDVASTTTIDTTTSAVPADRLKEIGTKNEVHVIGRDANGDPVVPGAGTFTVTVQTAKNGAFYALSDGGTLDATLCGGSATPSGTGEFATFNGVPLQVKVVPAGITTAVNYSVEVIQIGE